MRRQRGGATWPQGVIDNVTALDPIADRYETSFICHGVLEAPPLFTLPPGIEVITFTRTSGNHTLLLDEMLIIMECFRNNYYPPQPPAAGGGGPMVTLGGLIGAEWNLLNNIMLTGNNRDSSKYYRLQAHVYSGEMPNFPLTFKYVDEKDNTHGFFNPNTGNYTNNGRPRVADNMSYLELIGRNAIATEDLFTQGGLHFDSQRLTHFLHYRLPDKPVRLFLFACRGPPGPRDEDRMNVDDERLNPGKINNDGIYFDVSRHDNSYNAEGDEYSTGQIKFTNQTRSADLQVAYARIKAFREAMAPDINELTRRISGL